MRTVSPPHLKPSKGGSVPRGAAGTPRTPTPNPQAPPRQLPARLCARHARHAHRSLEFQLSTGGGDFSGTFGQLDIEWHLSSLIPPNLPYLPNLPNPSKEPPSPPHPLTPTCGPTFTGDPHRSPSSLFQALQPEPATLDPAIAPTRAPRGADLFRSISFSKTAHGYCWWQSTAIQIQTHQPLQK
jgi:hypothetical protein